MKYYDLSLLYKDMRRNGVEREHYLFSYSNVTFDIIFQIDTTPFKLLIGAHSHNWACILDVKPGFEISMKDRNFFDLCNVLNIKPGKGVFTSHLFLKQLIKHAPSKASISIVSPTVMHRFYSITNSTDDALKTSFRGWNDHSKDGRIARNFIKTEFYFGKKVADYCRANNISSIWTYPSDKPSKAPTYPWE